MTKADRAERAEDTTPVRTCVGCRRRRPIDLLLRVTRAGATVVVGGPSAGRGAWLCRATDGAGDVDAGCLGAAMRRRAFERAFRQPLGDEERTALEGLVPTARRALRPDAP